MEKKTKTPTNLKNEALKFLFILWCFLLLFVFIGCFFYLMDNPQLVTITFTNIGFAVFLAFANTCFSWARTFTDPGDNLLNHQINRVAYFCIFSALTFLMSSFLQFLISTKSLTIATYPLVSTIYSAFTLLRAICLMGVLLLSFGIVMESLRLIFKLLFVYVKIDPQGEGNVKQSLEFNTANQDPPQK